MKHISSCLLAFMAASAVSQGAMVITEWMYSGASGEFIEFTNTGSTSIDMSGWKYSDSDRASTVTVDLSAFGVVAAGESVILTEPASADFRTAWSLASSVKIIGGLTVNLGRADEINLYDNTSSLVDRLTFGDQAFAGSVRTQNVSGVADPQYYGLNDVTKWTLSVNGVAGAVTSTGGDVASPGFAPIPEPSMAALGCLGLLSLLRRRR